MEQSFEEKNVHMVFTSSSFGLWPYNPRHIRASTTSWSHWSQETKAGLFNRAAWTLAMPPKSISPSVTPGKRKHHKRPLEAGYSMFTPNWGDSFGVLLGFSLFCYVFSWLSLHWIWHHPYCTLTDQWVRKKNKKTWHQHGTCVTLQVCIIARHQRWP